jgi:NACHT domain- and WD repeat-containing protein
MLAERLAAVEAAHARPAHPALRPRPANIVHSCMRGDIAVLLRSSWFEHDSKQRVVRVFLSSTFTDTVHERAVLLRCVHPVVQYYARKLNFEVVLSEMRFGIRQSLSDDNKTSEVCMAELERCAEESASLSYMLFVRNKYGFRPPPRRVPRVDMQAMLALMPPGDKHLVQDFYELDENELISPQACYRLSANMHGAANIPDAAYVLRNTSLIANFWSRFSQLQTALRDAARLHWPSAMSELANYRSQHPIRFFFFSVTEEEICRGLFWKDAADIERSTRVFLRPIEAVGGGDLSSSDPDSKELSKFVDVADKKIDASAQGRLGTLRQMINEATAHAPTTVSTSGSAVEWLDGAGFHPRHAPHAIDLQKFACAATVCLLESLDCANERLAFQPHPDMAEVLHHMKFAHVRSRRFAHSSETEHVTAKLRAYLASAAGPGHAFVIHGASGSGKTYLMAEAADREAHALSSPGDAVIVRFLGTSPASSNLTDLLGSLCRQLHAIQADAAALPSNDDVEKLKEYFEHAMKTWQTGRLTVFLDSLDQLDDTCGGRKLGWLPTHGISPNVRLVVSTLPDEAEPADGKPFACLSILQKRYSGSPSGSAMAEVQPVDDVRSLLLHLLKLRHHKLSDAQLRVLEAAIKLSPRTQTPLVVTILAVRFSEWPSHRDLPPDNKNPDGSLFVDTSSVRSLIIQEFKALEAKHGPELVRAALSFITLAKDGVSETELSEILSLDDDVLASVYEWWVPPVRTLPTNPLTMLLADLKPYLTMRGAASGGGGLMMRWYHRQFWEAADVYFLHDAEERRRRHAQLGEFFSGAWADRSKPYNDRLRAAVQKKVAGEVSGDRRVRPQPLCLREGKSIFVTKGDAGAVNERRCREAAHHWLAAGMLCEAADELCSFEGICARARCGEGLSLQQQLMRLGPRIREGVRQRDVQAAQALKQLRRVEHYARWLQTYISGIIADPESETITSCSRQPEVSIAREDLKAYLNLTSAGMTLDRDSHFRSFVLGPVNVDFDSCVSELKHHKSYVSCVAYNVDCSLLASASGDKTVAVWNTKTGMVEFVLKGHTDKVTSVAWSPDGQQLATGETDAAR